eukprot:4026071-Prymnesium_polylepis.2
MHQTRANNESDADQSQEVDRKQQVMRWYAPGMHAIKLLEPTAGTRVPGRLRMHESELGLPI